MTIPLYPGTRTLNLYTGWYPHNTGREVIGLHSSSTIARSFIQSTIPIPAVLLLIRVSILELEAASLRLRFRASEIGERQSSDQNQAIAWFCSSLCLSGLSDCFCNFFFRRQGFPAEKNERPWHCQGALPSANWVPAFKPALGRRMILTMSLI